GNIITVAGVQAASGGFDIAGIVQDEAGDIVLSGILAYRSDPLSTTTVAGLSDGSFVVGWNGVHQQKENVFFQLYTAEGAVSGNAWNFEAPADGVIGRPVLQ